MDKRVSPLAKSKHHIKDIILPSWLSNMLHPAFRVDKGDGTKLRSMKEAQPKLDLLKSPIID